MAPVNKFDNIVMPGDTVTVPDSFLQSDAQWILGPGLRREHLKVIVTKPGILRHRRPNTFWVDCHQKRYVPARGDYVIGVVTSKGAENIRVNIGASEPASLSSLAFEGATKRSKPDVQVGDLVYAKVLEASKDMEAELVCVNSYGKKGDLGILPSSGFMVRVPLNHARKLLSPDCPLFSMLGEKVPFEVAVGQNGRIWIRSNTVKNTMFVFNAILSGELTTLTKGKDSSL